MSGENECRTQSGEQALDDFAILVGRAMAVGLLSDDRAFEAIVQGMVTMSYEIGESRERALSRFTPGYPGLQTAEDHWRYLENERE